VTDLIPLIKIQFDKLELNHSFAFKLKLLELLLVTDSKYQEVEHVT